ncbi:hypothetical protein VR010_02565 [Actinomycetaceae bacterium L2_0104]
MNAAQPDADSAARDEAIVAQIHAPIEVTLERDGDESVLIMRRRLVHDPRLLWKLISEPELLACWSPIVPSRPLTRVGPATCSENPGAQAVDAEVLVAEEPHKLVHRWGPELLVWTIRSASAAAPILEKPLAAQTPTPSQTPTPAPEDPAPEGSVLELRQVLSDAGGAAPNAAGWQIVFARLAAEDGSARERVVGERALAYDFHELLGRHSASFASS